MEIARPTVILLALAVGAAWGQPVRAENRTICVEVVAIGDQVVAAAEKPPSEAGHPPEQTKASKLLEALDKRRREAVQQPKGDEQAGWQETRGTAIPRPLDPAPAADPSEELEADMGRQKHNLPIGQTPLVYLARLIEHYVTHTKGYEAVKDAKACRDTIRVEMYPLLSGWTVFARYSGNGREERVDRLTAAELSQFAERVVEALLSDVPISTTIRRDTVLKADSEKSAQRIKGSHHFILALGTQLRGGTFDTAVTAGGTSAELRLFSPMALSSGYRAKFESWGLEALVRLAIQPSQGASPDDNPLGGHVDFGGATALQLHFFHFFSPRGLTSFYLGGGATFELMWFSAIREEAARHDDPTATLFGGGLDLDAVFGWEFMRASSVQFYLQGEFNLPAFVLDSNNNHGSLHTWFPGFSVQLGIVF